MGRIQGERGFVGMEEMGVGVIRDGDIGMMGGGPGLRTSWPVMCHRCMEFEMVNSKWDGHTFMRDGDRCRKTLFKEAKGGICSRFKRRLG